MTQSSINKIIEDVISGKTNDFEKIVDIFENRLFWYVKRISNFSDQMAEDILQETFIKAFKNLNNFDQNLKFANWIYRIARNETYSHYKKFSKEINNLSIDSDHEEDKKFLNLIPCEEDLVKISESKENIVKVKNVLNLMNQKYREILILKFIEELDYNEISEIIKKPTGTVATLINRGKKQFKKIVQNNKIEFN